MIAPSCFMDVFHAKNLQSLLIFNFGHDLCLRMMAAFSLIAAARVGTDSMRQQTQMLLDFR